MEDTQKRCKFTENKNLRKIRRFVILQFYRPPTGSFLEYAGMVITAAATPAAMRTVPSFLLLFTEATWFL